MRITASCRHIETIKNLKSDCGCTDHAVEEFRSCIYRHGGSIIKYAHNVLRCDNHDNNTQSVVGMLMQDGDQSKRERVHELVRDYMDTVCQYTDSYEY